MHRRDDGMFSCMQVTLAVRDGESLDVGVVDNDIDMLKVDLSRMVWCFPPQVLLV